MIYVDRLQPCTMDERWPWAYVGHLFADDFRELHRFASGLGLTRKMFRSNPMPHYELSPGMWKKAKERGAKVADRYTIKELGRSYRRAIKARAEG